MKRYEISCEISGPTAMWTHPDTDDVPGQLSGTDLCGSQGNLFVD